MKLDMLTTPLSFSCLAGLVHGNVSLRNIAGVPLPEDDISGSGIYWALSDLSCTSKQTDIGSFMAPISMNGCARFSTSAFPPEMFVKLSSGELRMYNEYWESVEKIHGSPLPDKAIIEPRFDDSTGDVYVLRCYFADSVTGLPDLPYKLLPTQEASDIWSFGRFLFTLCSSGHPLFPTNLRTDQLLDYDQVATWDREKRERLIYSHVDDPLAQDILLHLLSSHEERASLHMGTILKHPFFTTGIKNVQSTDKIIQRLIDQRTSDSVACKRSFERKVLMRAEDQWLRSRSETVSFWDLEFQIRMSLAPSELMMREFSGGNQRVATIPYSIIVLPYKLVRNKAGKLSPSTKNDVELAEKMGARLVALSKACHFTLRMEEVIRNATDSSRKWSASEISQAMNLPSKHFGEIDAKLATLASENVEVFRDSPLLIARSIVQELIEELHALFGETGKAFLYLVDEYECVPVIGTYGDISYPIEVTKKVSEVVGKGLPFLFLCILYARGVSGNLTGLVKLIFQAAYPHIPPSWEATSQGLTHALDNNQIQGELRILREAIVGNRGVDDMHYFQDYFERVDVKRTFADLKRVTNGDASLWTTNEGVVKIKEVASLHSLSDTYKEQKKVEQAMLKQQRKIAELQKTIEQLEFRRKHNLQEPIES